MRPSARSLARALDARDDVVAVHRLIEVRAGDDRCRRPCPSTGRSGNDESETARMRLDPADDEIHAIRQAESIAARLNQVSGLDQAVQQPLEGGPLLARDLQSLSPVPGPWRGGRRGPGWRSAIARYSTLKSILLFPTRVPLIPLQTV